MMNNLIANIKAQLGTESNMDGFVVEKYAGSEVAEELLALDDMDNFDAGMESVTEAVVGFGLVEQEAALESQGLDIAQFNRFEGTLGNESLTNMVKRGGYNVVIAIKKLVSKIWKFLMSIVDFFMICDGRWKSYSKLAKKYRGKINTLKIHSGEKEADKTYAIRDVAEAAKFIKEQINAISNVKRAQYKETDADKFAEEVIDSIEDIITAIVGNGAATGGTNEGAKERFAQFKEAFDEKVKEIREADEKSVSDAKSLLQSALLTIETSCKKDIKWFKEYKKISKDVEKSIEKLGKADSSTANDKLLVKLGETSQKLVEFKRTVNYTMKEVGSAIQMVLADAAKVISGETRIGD